MPRIYAADSCWLGDPTTPNLLKYAPGEHVLWVQDIPTNPPGEWAWGARLHDETGPLQPVGMFLKSLCTLVEDTPGPWSRVRCGADLAETLLMAFSRWAERPLYGDAAELAQREQSSASLRLSDGGIFVWATYAEVRDRALALASYLQGALPPHSTVAICSENRSSWALADIACLFAGMISVPLYTKSDDHTVSFIFKQASIACVVASADCMPQFLRLASAAARPATASPSSAAAASATATPAALSDAAPPLLAVLMDPASRHPALVAAAAASGTSLVDMATAEAAGARAPLPRAQLAPTDLATIMYTSGSTGNPKGAMMNERRWFKHCAAPYTVPTPNIELCLGPVAHIMGRQSIYICLLSGGKLAYYSQDKALLMDTIREYRPTSFSSVPRFWQELHGEFLGELERALAAPDVLPMAEDRERVRRGLLRKYAQSLGGRVEYIMTGGALTSPAVVAWLHECFECRVYNGLGATEVGGITSNGTVAHNVEIRLIDAPDVGYLTTDKPFPRGEMLVKTDNMIQGYFGEPAITAAAFTEDGFWRSGDIAELLPDGRYNVIDRRKNIFKLAQGEFIAPEVLEQLYCACSLVNQIFVHGDADRTHLVAVVVPFVEPLRAAISPEAAAATRGDDAALCAHPEAVRAVLQQLSVVAREARRHEYEVPTAVHLEHVAFTVENQLITSSNKVRRAGCQKFYAKILASLYSSAGVQARDSSAALLTVLAQACERVAAGASDAAAFVQHAQAELTAFVRLGADSLSAMQLAKTLRERHAGGRVVPLELIYQGDAAALVDFLTGRAKSAAVDDALRADLDELARLARQEPALHVARFGCELTAERPTVVMLTGATGHLGAHLLVALLERPATALQKLVCLVRGADAFSALSRLRSTLVGKGVAPALLDDPRLVVYAGDVHQANMGLEQLTWEKLAAETTLTIHAAAAVNWMLPYASLRAANVDGTKQAIEFVRASPGRLLFVGTAGVAAADARDDGADGPSFYEPVQALSGYSQSKWVAEKFVHAAVKHHGVRALVVRPAMITGHSRSGNMNTGDFVPRYLIGCVQLRCYLDLPDSLQDMAPVDAVAAALVALADATFASGTVFTVCAPRMQSFREIGAATAAFCRKHSLPEPQPASWEQFRAALANAPPTCPLVPLRDTVFGERGGAGRPRTSAAVDLNRAWAAASVECPAGSDALVDTYLGELHRLGLLLREPGIH